MTTTRLLPSTDGGALVGVVGTGVGADEVGETVVEGAAVEAGAGGTGGGGGAVEQATSARPEASAAADSARTERRGAGTVGSLPRPVIPPVHFRRAPLRR
jgi:hypothetical protein